MVKIEILGTGCAKCKSLLTNVEKAVSESAIQAEIVNVDSIQEIMDRGVMMTRALHADGQVQDYFSNSSSRFLPLCQDLYKKSPSSGLLSCVSAKVTERPRNCLQSNTNPIRLRTLALVISS